jgi:hypothetical protein
MTAETGIVGGDGATHEEKPVAGDAERDRRQQAEADPDVFL